MVRTPLQWLAIDPGTAIAPAQQPRWHNVDRGRFHRVDVVRDPFHGRVANVEGGLGSRA